MDTSQTLVGEDIDAGAQRRIELTDHLGLDEATKAPNIDVSRSPQTSFVSSGEEKEKEDKEEVTLFRSLLLP